VRGSMAERFPAVLVLKGEKFHRAVLRQRGAQIADRSVDPHGAGRPVEAHRNVAAERLRRGVFGHLADVAAFTCNVQHGNHSFSILKHVLGAKNTKPRPL